MRLHHRRQAPCPEPYWEPVRLEAAASRVVRDWVGDAETGVVSKIPAPTIAIPEVTYGRMESFMTSSLARCPVAETPREGARESMI